jgi:hypothetical protein
VLVEGRRAYPMTGTPHAVVGTATVMGGGACRSATATAVSTLATVCSPVVPSGTSPAPVLGTRGRGCGGDSSRRDVGWR